MTKTYLTRFFAILAASGLTFFTSCENDSELEDAAEEAGDAVEEAADEVEDAVD